jgi:hypothetical protein
MKLGNIMLAGFFLITLGVSSCATLGPRMTEEEEEIATSPDNQRFDRVTLDRDGGDD